jgi:gamma-glutamyltranspeptidase/glutathione hydrolase
MIDLTHWAGKVRRRSRAGQIVIGACSALILASGCSRLPGLDSRAEGYVQGFNGAVAGDEPQAVLVARDILAAGGSAADAVVAAYFTMAVTLPTAASLGAGGVCLVHDKVKAVEEAIEFTHPTSGPFAGQVAPLAPRAMQALHAKYGHLPWTQLVGPAESLARLGHPASRAFARAVARAPGRVGAPGMAQIFADKLGHPVAEGARVQQVALAATLSILRRQPVQMYSGPLARRLVADYARAGAALTAEGLRGLVPHFRPVVTVERGNQVAHFPPTPAGVVTAQAWAMLYREGAWSDVDADERPRLLAEVSRRAFADAGRWFAARGGVGDGEPFVSEARVERLMRGLEDDAVGAVPVVDRASAFVEPADQGSASIIALDVFGRAVACAFTMNGTMGAGQLARETGVVIAAPPDPEGKGTAALGLMMVRIGTQQQLEFLGAATGGAVVPITLATAAAKTLETKDTAEAMLAAPRFYHPARPDHVVIEDRADARAIADRLRKSGHQVVTAPSPLGRANILICPRGFDAERSQCDVRTDRRAFGLAQQN